MVGRARITERLSENAGTSQTPRLRPRTQLVQGVAPPVTGQAFSVCGLPMVGNSVSSLATPAPALLRRGHGGKVRRAIDVPSFRDFFEMAVLAHVDQCFIQGHFGSLVNRLRGHLGRAACSA